jgi:hypothetical protein
MCGSERRLRIPRTPRRCRPSLYGRCISLHSYPKLVPGITQGAVMYPSTKEGWRGQIRDHEEANDPGLPGSRGGTIRRLELDLTSLA